MTFTQIKSCNKYLLSYKDLSNNTHQIDFYAQGAIKCLVFSKEFKSYLKDKISSLVKIQQKFRGNYS